ncbi:MAG TPA: translocation/assembly module TamB domain-containing protein [Candidatus Limnocylindrales bacterium]|nr:translocation/assembly module TamB domain-containing protein [Candidatus Limnocylindrales bacterium]
MNWNWKKIILWAVIAVFVLVIGIGLTAVLLVQHNSGFRGYLLAKVESSVKESTGATLQVRDFGLRLSTLTLDMYGIVVHGTEPASAPPLLQADHLGVGVTIDSVLQRKFHFRAIEVNHPVVSVRVNTAGENNLPKPEKKSTSSSNTNVFDLGIRQLLLDHGEIYYNDQKTPLSANLRNLELTAGYDPGPKRYQGHLQYEDGHIQYGHYAPLPHNMDAGFALTPQRFVLDRMVLGLGQSQVVLNATVDDYSNNPNVQANYQASLVTGELAAVLKNPSVPEGTVRLTGTAQYQGKPGEPALNSAVVRGMVSSPELYVKTSSVHTAIRNLSAKYELEHGNATVENMRAELLGGRFQGKLALLDVAGNGQGRLQASLKDVSLDVLQKIAQANSLREAHLVGNLNADAQVSWIKSISNLTASANATLQAAIGQNPSTPIDGVIHADYSAARQEVALHQSYIKTPKTSINLDGKVSELSQLQIRMHSDDLHEIETVAANFKTASASGTPQRLDLFGTADFVGSVSGSTKNPSIQGQFSANNLRVKGSSWRLVRTNINASPSQATLSNGELLSATQGRFTFTVHTGLREWAYTPNSPITVQLNASQVSIADLERLANKTYPVSGTLAMNVSLHGSQQNPVGNGTLTVTNAKVSNETVQSLNLNFKGDGNAVNTKLQIKMPAGTTEATGVIYPRTQAYELKVTGNNIRLEKLQAVAAKNLQIAGAIDINAQGKGTLKNPQLSASIDIPQLQVQKQTIQRIKFQTTVQNHVANFALDSAVAQTYVKGRGTVGLNAPYPSDVHLDTGRIAFAPLLALYAPAQAGDVGGETELHVSLRGPLAEKNRLEAHLEIPVLVANYKEVKLAAARPIHLDYQSGIAVLQPTSIQGTGTDVRMQGSVPVNNLKAATFLLQGTVDLSIAKMVQPDIISKGQIQFDIDSRRYSAGSNLNGQLKIVNASFHTPASPVGLDNANGVISVTRQRLEIASFQGQVGGGTVTARGGVAFSPAVQFDLAMSAKQIRLRYPEGLRTIIDSNLAYTGNLQASTVTGAVTVDHMSLTPEFDLSSFTDQFSGSGGGAPSSPFEQSIKLNIAVQSSSQMDLASSQVSIQGNANLRVTGTAAQPVILGRTNLTGGELFLAGNRYIIQQGTIEFLNPVRTEPVVNLQVRTTINEYNISLNIQGPVERLHTNFTSDPALPPVDIINLIARGQTTEAAAASQGQPLALGAQSALASAVSGQVSNRIAKVAGISHLSVDPALGGNGQDPGARISIQQRVTSNMYLTFATDVTSTQRQAIELEYRLNRRWSLQGVRDQNGGFGVDAHYTKEY